MRVYLAAASLLVCLAAVSCKHDASPQKEGTSPGSSAASTGPSAKEQTTEHDAGKPTPEAKHERRGRGSKIPFGQRPPKPEKVSAPQVPELPALAKQERPTPPAKLPVGEFACGASHSGDHDYPLMCLEDKNHDKDEKVARLLVPFKEMKEKTAPLPKVVDHRTEKTESEIRNQGGAGTCTAFGTSAAIDHSVALWTGTPAHISVMELWGRYHQPDIGDALVGAIGQTFGSEEAWPYNDKVAWEWRTCAKSEPKSGGACGKPVDKAKLAELEKKPVVVVEQVQWLPKDFEIIRHKIAAGRDPIFGLRVPRHFMPTGKAGSRYIADYKEESGGHALALAGYVIGEKGDNYYLIHNSWGTTWGDGGYAWIHEATLAKHMLSGFGIIDARPIDSPKEHREGKVCSGGQAPDSLTGQCMAECKEGGPTHNGVCPEAGDCESGYVNLFGECVGAAPKDVGKEEKEGISWKCGPGGCAYTLPKSIGKCSSEPCMVSCAAPNFRAAKDDHGLTCVE